MSFFCSYVHIGPRLTSLLADASTAASPEPGLSFIRMSPWTQLGLAPSAVLLVCANVFHNKSRELACLPPTTILVEYGFQVGFAMTVYTKCPYSDKMVYYKLLCSVNLGLLLYAFVKIFF